MITWFRKLGMWITKNWKWIVRTLALAGAMLVIYLTRNNLKEFLIEKKKIDIKRKKRDIEALEAKKAIISTGIQKTEAKIKKVDAVLAQIDESIKKERKDISTLTKGEKLDKFDELGY